MNLKTMGIKELLKLQAWITDELKVRDVVRTKNNPLGDYTEWLVGNALGLQLQMNSKVGYDGITGNGVRVQIKGRRITPGNKSRQLSAIRKYDEKDFDDLAAVIFDENFEIIDAVLIPPSCQNSCRLDTFCIIRGREVINGKVLKRIQTTSCSTVTAAGVFSGRSGIKGDRNLHGDLGTVALRSTGSAEQR
jgi:hypothetical protein